MVLEATMICMRNEDYPPSRFEAQAHAVYLITGAKIQMNLENTVGILAMAGKRARVLTTPTNDLGKFLDCMHGVELEDEMNMTAAILISQLALKHRENKSQQQRIIVFAGSPVQCDKNTLELIGKNLKKNSVALDIVNFGEDDEGKTEKLEALLAAVNNNESSHIVHIAPAPDALSDVLMSTPVLNGDTEASGERDFEFGIDPNIDPELALALRISMEEERARQEAASKSAAEESSRYEDMMFSLQLSDFHNKTAPKSAEELDRITDDYLAWLKLGCADTPDEAHGDRELSIDAAKDERSHVDMSEDMDYRSFMPFDLNEPPVEDVLASFESQSECEEKKKEGMPPNDEN